MTDGDNLRDVAIANATSLIKKEVRFPRNVFTRIWDDYLFFESYMMFDDVFVSAKDIILREEPASAIAVVNLGNVSIAPNVEERAICLEKDTAVSEYIATLKGDGSPLNWLFLMDRYVCASDKGNWCMYCEKENDIAVLAVQDTFSASTVLQLRNLLKAESIKAIDAPKTERLFDFDKLVPSWKAVLSAEYSC
jgi:hypothetical protein